jgi:hypothetical protein
MNVVRALRLVEEEEDGEEAAERPRCCGSPSTAPGRWTPCWWPRSSRGSAWPPWSPSWAGPPRRRWWVLAAAVRRRRAQPRRRRGRSPDGGAAPPRYGRARLARPGGCWSSCSIPVSTASVVARPGVGPARHEVSGPYAGDDELRALDDDGGGGRRRARAGGAGDDPLHLRARRDAGPRGHGPPAGHGQRAGGRPDRTRSSGSRSTAATRGSRSTTRVRSTHRRRRLRQGPAPPPGDPAGADGWAT